jgi:hypothetical protein
MNGIMNTLGSRSFQNAAGQVAIAVVTLVVTSVVSQKVSGTLNVGLQAMLDKIHNTVVETPQA